MSIQVYNTLTQRKEIFEPLEGRRVKMYVCGPTVYNYIHVGNARPAVVFDTVRRYLEYRGYEVLYVSNFTDVDDKLIKASKELGEEVPVLAERFIKAYFEDIEALGCRRANVHPRVTETMDEIIEFIQRLMEKGYAYESDGDVYFRTRRFKEYGKLSHQSIEDLQLGARIEIGEKKEDPLDFALWKAAKPGEIYWDSPWGKGRPGWHIECSTMAKKYLGEQIDIHAAGQDLIFPHHENEIAQTEALTGKPFAKYWMHVGYIKIDNEKMSKSLGNFVLVHDLLKEVEAKVVRFFILSHHYHYPMNFSREGLEDAKAGLERLEIAYHNLHHRLQASTNLTEDDAEQLGKLAALRDKFIAVMDDDFNTANAISVLFELAKDANTYLRKKATSEKVLREYIALFEELGSVLGLEFKVEQLTDERIEELIRKREEARKNRDFQTADRIRDQLRELNVIIEDTPQGTRWRRG
mgnify:CR=1 FL=1|jgi:cysteinyl-tRNA synthetase (EC 6.1.1.16)